MIGYEKTPDYDPTIRAFHYMPDGSVAEVDPELSDLEQDAGDFAHALAQEAFRDGNPPVGAVLLVNQGERAFGAKTHDKTSLKINGHAEVVAYEDAYKIVGDDLSAATVMSTANLCSTCTPLYAEGKIGKIVTAAPRRFIYQLPGLMRPRNINMHELLADGETDTISIINYQLERSLALFALYGKLKEHKLPPDLDPFLRPIVEEVYDTTAA